jgi:hypothetical protein
MKCGSMGITEMFSMLCRHRKMSTSSGEGHAKRLRSRTSETDGTKPLLPAAAKDVTGGGNKIIEEEKSAVGSVKLSVYAAYIRASSVFLFVVMVMTIVATQAVNALSGIWLTKWTTDPLLTNTSVPHNTSEYDDQRDLYLGVYGGLGALQGEDVILLIEFFAEAINIGRIHLCKIRIRIRVSVFILCGHL